MKKIYLPLLLLCIYAATPLRAQEYPHIQVKNSQKAEILQKIEQNEWAKKIYENLLEEVTPYARRHMTDPVWITSRYLMNRVPGKRYTRFISDAEGTKLIGYDGDAPVPTIRVSPHKRGPVTPQGGSYKAPALEELIPYDTSMTMSLLNTNTGEYERIDPQNMVGNINGRINRLAHHSAVLYWLTGKEMYAKMAADLLDQWAKGAYYQQFIEGPGRTGFINIQTLGDEASKEMVLAYDFVQPYMKRRGYDLSYYQPVFEKVASVMAFRGYTNNNWYAAESSTMVAAALALEDPARRDYFLQFYLSKDTVVNGIGQLALPSTIKIWLTDDGHWREPGGYHNYPVSKLLEAGMYLENNGYRVFEEFPQLFEASYALIKYSFPNLTVSAYGDTGRAGQSTETLEIGLLMADKYKKPIFDDILSVMQVMEKNGYDRARTGSTGLLCYLPRIPDKSVPAFRWPRSGHLDFAHSYIQRNGMDKENGLMYDVQGATYNHNHSNGMAVELYGKGDIMGVDPGNGPNYEHPMHVTYYAVWAAHNTVVAAGASSSVPEFRGGGGTKHIGGIELIGMEPMAEQAAVSEDYSFTDTKYFEPSTRTNQQRTLALVRTSPEAGYYLDIYRSDNPVSNDYLYHNAGDDVKLFGADGREIAMNAVAAYPTGERDLPGFRHFKEVYSSGAYGQPVTARFEMRSGEGAPRYMQVMMPGSANRTYYKAMGPNSKTLSAPYNRMPTPIFTARTEGPAAAWNDPFIAVYEPYRGSDAAQVQRVSRRLFDKQGDRIAVTVDRKGGNAETIFQARTDAAMTDGNKTFRGKFGIVSTENGKTKALYIGEGSEIRTPQYGIRSRKGNAAASLKVQDEGILVSASAPVVLTINDPAVKGISYTGADGKTVSLSGSRMTVSLPACQGLLIAVK